MSIHAITAVFELDLKPHLKWLLVCLADNSDPFGNKVRPSIATLSAKSGFPERTTQRHMRELETMGLIKLVAEARPKRAREYQLTFMKPEGWTNPAPRESCSPRLRLDVIEVFEYTCQYCNEKGNKKLGPDGRAWHIDRIIPGSKGGSYAPENVTLSCGRCNSIKGAKTAPTAESMGAKLEFRGAKSDVYGCQSLAPDPSFKPSIEPSVEEEDRGYPFDNFAVVEYVEALQPQPDLAIFQAETIADAIRDDQVSRAVWTDVLRIFKGNGYQRRYAGNAVDRYLSEMRDIASGKKEAPIVKGRVLTIRESMGINA